MLGEKDDVTKEDISADQSSPPFSIKLLDGEKGKCVFCITREKFEDSDVKKCSNGCVIPSDSNELIFWTAKLFKKFEIYIDWFNSSDGQPQYREPPIWKDPATYIRL